jgi:hypothetical protein
LFVVDPQTIYYKKVNMVKITKNIEELFSLVRSALGAPVRSVELTNEQLCDLLQIAIQDYSSAVQNEIILNNWMGFYGKNVNSTKDLLSGFMVRSLDLTKDYGAWFSKQVGLQTLKSGDYWELKKDYVTIEAGKQVYVIPSGRTINKVMYVNPPMTDTALFANYMGGGVGFMPGMGQVGAGYGYGGGLGGFYTTQAMDVAYMAADLNFKSRLFRSDLTYKVTAGPDGTHLLHLMSTPGSKLSFGFAGASVNGGIGLIGCEVWYTYYDTSDGSEDDCMLYHADDVILSPDQVPMENMQYEYLNDPSKVVVRQLLIAKAKQTLGLIRGKFSGKVSIPQAEMTMDYQMLTQQGKEEYDATMEALMKRLERMRPVNMMKEQSEMMESNVKIQQYTPLGIYVI